jgi:hypothetical protein
MATSKYQNITRNSSHFKHFRLRYGIVRTKGAKRKRWGRRDEREKENSELNGQAVNMNSRDMLLQVVETQSQITNHNMAMDGNCLFITWWTMWHCPNLLYIIHIYINEDNSKNCELCRAFVSCFSFVLFEYLFLDLALLFKTILRRFVSSFDWLHDQSD